MFVKEILYIIREYYVLSYVKKFKLHLDKIFTAHNKKNYTRKNISTTRKISEVSQI